MTLEPGTIDHILKLARAVQAETYTADGDIPGAKNIMFFREGFTKAYDRFQDAMSPDVAIALCEELKELRDSVAWCNSRSCEP